MRSVWIFVVGVFVFLGVLAWVMNGMDSELNKQPIKTEKAKILDWYPNKEGIVLTVNINGKLYRIYTNATTLNIKEPVEIIFREKIPVNVKQNGRVYKIIDWEELKTLENMPEVKKS